MKTIFKNHSEAVLIFLAAIFLVVIVWFVYDAIQVVVAQVNRVLISPSAPMEAGFDLGDATQIDFRGLMTNASSSVTSSPANPATTTPSTTSF